jgi:hypothetical protein
MLSSSGVPSHSPSSSPWPDHSDMTDKLAQLQLGELEA